MEHRWIRHLPVAVMIVAIAVYACAQPSGDIRWTWSGAVTSSGAVVKARAARPGLALRLAVTPADGGAVAYERTVEADSRGVATFPIDSLKLRTAYEYVVSTQEHRLRGAFKTFAEGAMPFRVVYGSCARTGSSSPIFEEMRRLDPDLFIHMGDFHYENITANDPARFARAYDAVLASRTQSALYRAAPIVYTWDDHDFGNNNSDATSPSRPAALDTYDAFVPHYPLVSRDSIQQAFSIGRVRLIVTDSRSGRTPMTGDPRKRTMLGPAQLEWLEREFESAKEAPLVVWVNSLPWITRGDERNSDGWAPYARERERIANHLATLQLTERVIMLSGDAHMVAIDDGTNSLYATIATPARGFVVAHAAPFDQRPKKKGGPYSSGESLANEQFGVLDVADDGTTLKATVTGRNDRGTLLRMKLTLVCAASRCQIDRNTAP
jgi:phosphodiesterase/alkaline phosphatase D-like protein